MKTKIAAILILTLILPSPTFALREVGLEERSEREKEKLRLALTQSQKPAPFPLPAGRQANVQGSPTGLEEVEESRRRLLRDLERFVNGLTLVTPPKKAASMHHSDAGRRYSFSLKPSKGLKERQVIVDEVTFDELDLKEPLPTFVFLRYDPRTITDPLELLDGILLALESNGQTVWNSDEFERDFLPYRKDLLRRVKKAKVEPPRFGHLPSERKVHPSFRSLLKDLRWFCADPPWGKSLSWNEAERLERLGGNLLRLDPASWEDVTGEELSRSIRPGDILSLRRGESSFEVVLDVRGEFITYANFRKVRGEVEFFYLPNRPLRVFHTTKSEVNQWTPHLQLNLSKARLRGTAGPSTPLGTGLEEKRGKQTESTRRMGKVSHQEESRKRQVTRRRFLTLGTLTLTAAAASGYYYWYSRKDGTLTKAPSSPSFRHQGPTAPASEVSVAVDSGLSDPKYQPEIKAFIGELHHYLNELNEDIEKRAGISPRETEAVRAFRELASEKIRLIRDQLHVWGTFTHERLVSEEGKAWHVERRLGLDMGLWKELLDKHKQGDLEAGRKLQEQVLWEGTMLKELKEGEFLSFLQEAHQELSRERNPALGSLSAFQWAAQRYGIVLNVSDPEDSNAPSGSARIGWAEIEGEPGRATLIPEVHVDYRLYQDLKSRFNDQGLSAQARRFFKDMLIALVVKEGGPIEDAQHNPQRYFDILKISSDFKSKGIRLDHPSFERALADPATMRLTKEFLATQTFAEVIGYERELAFMRARGVTAELLKKFGQADKSSVVEETFLRFFNLLGAVGDLKGLELAKALRINVFQKEVNSSHPVAAMLIYREGERKGAIKIVPREDKPGFGTVSGTDEALSFLWDPEFTHEKPSKASVAPPAQKSPRRAGLEEVDAEEFVKRYPQQAANVPKGTSRIVVVPDGEVTLYRPETLAGGLEEIVASEQNQFPGLRINRKLVPPSAAGVKPPAVIIWDKMLGDLPYTSPVPVVEHQLGQLFPYRLPQLIAMALLGRKDDAVYLLSIWAFEREGRQVLALAVKA